MRKRCLQTTLFLASVLSVALTAVLTTAWACVPFPQALATLQPQSSGPPGTEVTVHGLGYDKGPIEIRWNALDGPRLASATGPDFSVPVTIPEAPDGLYSVVVLSRAQDGSIGSAGSTPFQVISPGSGGPGTNPSPSKTSSPSSRSSVPALLTGGALVVVGALIGAVASRRRRSRDR